MRGIVPCSAERYNRTFRLNTAAVEHIALVVQIGVACGDDIASATIDIAFLAVEQYILEEDATVAADIVHGAVNLAVLEIAHGTNLVGIVGVLVGEQAHVLAYRMRTFVPESDRTAVIVFVIVQCVLQGEVLQVDVVARQQECGGVVD